MKDVVTRLKRRPREEKLWVELLEKLRPRVYYLVFRLTGGDLPTSEDLTQETFLRFLEYDGLKKVGSEGAALAYLRVIARNLVFDNARRSARQAGEVPIENIGESELSWALGRTSDTERISQEVLADLKNDLKALRLSLNEDGDRLLSLLIKGTRVADIAKTLGLSYSAAAVRIYRLKKDLAARASKP